MTYFPFIRLIVEVRFIARVRSKVDEGGPGKLKAFARIHVFGAHMLESVTNSGLPDRGEFDFILRIRRLNWPGVGGSAHTAVW